VLGKETGLQCFKCAMPRSAPKQAMAASCKIPHLGPLDSCKIPHLGPLDCVHSTRSHHHPTWDSSRWFARTSSFLAEESSPAFLCCKAENSPQSSMLRCGLSFDLPITGTSVLWHLLGRWVRFHDSLQCLRLLRLFNPGWLYDESAAFDSSDARGENLLLRIAGIVSSSCPPIRTTRRFILFVCLCVHFSTDYAFVYES
jgi:hypothetical protein